MAAYVVTQYPSDAEMLRRSLPPELLGTIVFVPAGNLSDVKSLACSLIVARRIPVAVVLDAHTTDPELLCERQQGLDEVIGFVTSSVPFRVILVIPTIEEALYPRLSDRLKASVASNGSGSAEPISLGNADQAPPTPFLELLDTLTPDEIESARNTPAVKELVEFLRQSREGALPHLAARQ